ncbi:hypothetical protein ACFVYE_46965 [Streptomyces sp. NPDC058239]|uniref:hypothetical protein n=1 Tax=Streptomyces sp. NPDC058239 TaxID=3346395 RepID=UPI0036F15FB5
MDSERGPKGGRTLASKLEHLFETVIPPGRGPYGTEEVAQAIAASGASISGSYVWLLRKGQRDNPTMRHLQGIVGGLRTWVLDHFPCSGHGGSPQPRS